MHWPLATAKQSGIICYAVQDIREYHIRWSGQKQLKFGRLKSKLSVTSDDICFLADKMIRVGLNSGQ